MAPKDSGWVVEHGDHHVRRVGAFDLVVAVDARFGRWWRVSVNGTEDIVTGSEPDLESAKAACEDAAREAGIAVP